MFQKLKGPESDEMRRKNMRILTKNLNRRNYAIPKRTSSIVLSTSNLHLLLFWVRRPLNQVLGMKKKVDNARSLRKLPQKIEQAAVNVSPQTIHVCLSLLQ